MNTKGKAYPAILLAVWLLGLSNQVSRAQLLPVTPHELLPEQKIVVEGQEVPPWKALWDDARKSALQGEFDKAVRQYQGLLVLKDNLEEARWELARLMTHLKRWDDAAQLLELLIESAPDNMQYINGLGKVMWEMGQYERAVALFKRVYEEKPADQTALAGLVEGLTRLNRKNEALPYLEQLVTQEPANRGVRRYLALLLYEAGNFEKARGHFTILARSEDASTDVLDKTARTYENLGRAQQAAVYWERILGREPKNIEAHRYLARHYEQAGQPDRSQLHLEAILALNPDDAAAYAELGRLHEKAGNFDQALSYYEKFLAANPGNREIAGRAANLNAAIKQQGKIKTAVGRPAAAADLELRVDLEQTVRSLMDGGQYQAAAASYRQLLNVSQDERKVLDALARDLVDIGRSRGRDMMLEFFRDVAAADKTIYRNLVEPLSRISREEELLALLGEIHQLEPEDSYITRELAILHVNRGEYSLSRNYFAELPEADCRDVRCLEARAGLKAAFNLAAGELRDYEALLELQADRYEIRLKAVELAARLGLLDTALFHAGYLENLASAPKNLELKTYLADGYRKSGYLSRAVERYRNIIDQTAGMNESEIVGLRIRARLSLADSYKKLGLIYEAEQALRSGLALEEQRQPLLAALFYLFLETGRTAESDIWLQAISRRPAAGELDSLTAADPAWPAEFFRAEMQAAAGDYEQAVELYRVAEAVSAEAKNRLAVGSSRPYDETVTVTAFLIRLRLAMGLLQAGRFAEAESLALALRNDHGQAAEPLVLLERIYQDWGNTVRVEEVSREADRYGAQDLGRLLRLAELYREYGIIPRQAEAAEKAAALSDESLAAKKALAAARLEQGEYLATLELLRQYLRYYPENTWFLSQQAELLARVGEFQEALDIAAMILADNPERRDIILLQSRILWEMKRWRDAVALYQAVVEPPVEDLLARRIEARALSVGQTPAESTWLRKITFSQGPAPKIADIVMAPRQAVDFSAEARIVNEVAADFYALYRWQDRFSRELSVRRSVMRREYYHAANKLEQLIEEFGPDDFLLYDLAGLYSRLDRLGDEANIYRKLAGRNDYFPGLAEAVQRNDLKRRPQVYLTYDIQDDDGWDGYKAVRRETGGAGWNYYRNPSQQWTLDAARINYESTRNAQNLKSWRTLLTYDQKLSHSLGLSLGAGIEKPESDFSDTFLFSGSFTGKIADEMRAVLSVKQDVVADTIASLKRNIIRKDYKIEFLFDLFPRLLLGGYFDFRDYSDSNWTNSYAFWASYILLPEPTLMKISYNYDFYDSREGNKPGPPAADGFAPDDHPYWSPVNYWITRFSFYFKHQLSNDTLARGVPSYYTIEYFLGYDTEDNDLHEWKGSFNFEIARNYTVSASYGYLDLDVYQHEEVFLSLMYRF